MTGWIAVISVAFLFACVIGGLLRTAMGPLTDEDFRCGEIEDDLNARYGGWRN